MAVLDDLQSVFSTEDEIQTVSDTQTDQNDTQLQVAFVKGNTDQSSSVENGQFFFDEIKKELSLKLNGENIGISGRVIPVDKLPIENIKEDSIYALFEGECKELDLTTNDYENWIYNDEDDCIYIKNINQFFKNVNEQRDLILIEYYDSENNIYTKTNAINCFCVRNLPVEYNKIYILNQTYIFKYNANTDSCELVNKIPEGLECNDSSWSWEDLQKTGFELVSVDLVPSNIKKLKGYYYYNNRNWYNCSEETFKFVIELPEVGEQNKIYKLISEYKNYEDYDCEKLEVDKIDGGADAGGYENIIIDPSKEIDVDKNKTYSVQEYTAYNRTSNKQLTYFITDISHPIIESSAHTIINNTHQNDETILLNNKIIIEVEYKYFQGKITESIVNVVKNIPISEFEFFKKNLEYEAGFDVNRANEDNMYLYLGKRNVRQYSVKNGVPKSDEYIVDSAYIYTNEWIKLGSSDNSCNSQSVITIDNNYEEEIKQNQIYYNSDENNIYFEDTSGETHNLSQGIISIDDIDNFNPIPNQLYHFTVPNQLAFYDENNNARYLSQGIIPVDSDDEVEIIPFQLYHNTNTDEVYYYDIYYKETRYITSKSHSSDSVEINNSTITFKTDYDNYEESFTLNQSENKDITLPINNSTITFVDGINNLGNVKLNQNNDSIIDIDGIYYPYSERIIGNSNENSNEISNIICFREGENFGNYVTSSGNLDLLRYGIYLYDANNKLVRSSAEIALSDLEAYGRYFYNPQHDFGTLYENESKHKDSTFLKEYDFENLYMSGYYDLKNKKITIFHAAMAGGGCPYYFSHPIQSDYLNDKGEANSYLINDYLNDKGGANLYLINIHVGTISDDKLIIPKFNEVFCYDESGDNKNIAPEVYLAGRICRFNHTVLSDYDIRLLENKLDGFYKIKYVQGLSYNDVDDYHFLDDTTFIDPTIREACTFDEVDESLLPTKSDIEFICNNYYIFNVAGNTAFLRENTDITMGELYIGRKNFNIPLNEYMWISNSEHNAVKFTNGLEDVTYVKLDNSQQCKYQQVYRDIKVQTKYFQIINGLIFDLGTPLNDEYTN